MALGYQGLILLDGYQYLVIDGNLDHVRPLIASEGTYAPNTIAEATGRVHTFDLDELTGGFNIDTNANLLDTLFDVDTGWITQRDQSKSLLWYSNKENDYEFGDAFWTRASLSAGPGSILTTSMDVVMIPGAETDDFEDNPFDSLNDYPLPTRHLQAGDDYIGQKFGFEVSGDITKPIDFAKPPLYQPIPYWQTKFNLDDLSGNPLPDGIYVTNWSLEMTNNISRRNVCMAARYTEDHPGPTLIQIGMASVTLNLSFVTVITPGAEGSKDFLIPERFSNVTINIGSDAAPRILSLGRMDASIDGNEESTSIQQSSDATNITGAGSLTEMTYIASGYFTLPHLI